MKDITNKSEDNNEANFFAEREKGADILILSNVSTLVDQVPDCKFVLTGSYAIEALTGIKIYHEDIDANIYTPDINLYLPKIASHMESFQNLKLYKKTQDRLEYDIVPDIHRVLSKKVEFQFHTGDAPTVMAPLLDSSENKFLFRVKSLPYVIATWSIRVSGQALNPKRELRNNDLEQFRSLLACKYSRDEVLEAIKNHPQMPRDAIPDQIIEMAFSKL